MWRKPIRTVLTILSIAVAFLLFGVLQGVITGFEGARAKLSDTRLRVTNRANIIEGIPIAYKSQIDRVAGVDAVSYFTIFIGYYQDRKNGFSIAAVDVDSWLDAIPNFHVPDEQRAAMHTTRTGALVGAELMKRFDWHIGDRISLHSMMWANKDGTTEWPVDIVGIVNAGPDDDPQFGTELYFNYDYLDSSRTAKEGTVSQFVVTPDKGADPNAIAIAIDRLFANSNAETTTLNERASGLPPTPGTSATCSGSSTGSPAPCCSRCCSWPAIRCRNRFAIDYRNSACSKRWDSPTTKCGC